MCEDKQYITCPYCGDENIDSWESDKDKLETDYKETECFNCGKKFEWRRGFRVWYDMEKIKE